MVYIIVWSDNHDGGVEAVATKEAAEAFLNSRKDWTRIIIYHGRQIVPEKVETVIQWRIKS